ncbi:MAG: hypothetical protein OQJ93_06710 [Ignavibacteriaceae bacterium]|nr:hypothetical protein [Ignavibacteriaceae bacterium]
MRPGKLPYTSASKPYSALKPAGVELSSEVADGSSQIILYQVTNGVAIRMAVLYLLGTLN